MTEEELRALILRSQKEGFRALFEQYHGYVYKIIWERLRSVGTYEDAEECISDTFAQVFSRYDDIRIGSMKAFIGTVAKRTAIHKFRSLTAKAVPDTADDVLDSIPDELDIEENAVQSEYYSRLYEHIRSLGEPDSTIVIQRYFYDRKSGDIAKHVGMTATAVRVRLNRALKRLRKLLDSDNMGNRGESS